MKKLSAEELEQITSFIGREQYGLKEKLKYDNREDIIILIPNWLLDLFKAFYQRDTSKTPISTAFFFGCIVQSHYKDEVVVFYKDYHLNPELFEPKVYSIN